MAATAAVGKAATDPGMPATDHCNPNPALFLQKITEETKKRESAHSVPSAAPVK
jgi:hypothetical protein